MRYLIKVDYTCERVKTGGSWLVVEQDSRPIPGVIDTKPFAGGVLPNHDCRRYYDSQLCEDDPSCFWQEILDVQPYSIEHAKTLEAITV